MPDPTPSPLWQPRYTLTRAAVRALLEIEAYHARDLAAYYSSLVTHPHHNYYEGRAEADLTPWLEYFLQILAAVFDAVQKEAMEAAGVDCRQFNGNSSAVYRQ